MSAGFDERGAPALLDGVRRWLAESGAEPTPARVAQALREQGRVLGDAEVLGAAERMRSELVGSGPLEPLLADPSVTDVLVSAPDRVWVDRGGGLERADVSFPDAAAVRRLAQRLAAVAGRRLDDARPWVDARLPDGTRLHAVLPPVAVGCTCLALRVVRPRAFTLDELVAAGTVPPGGDRVLRALLEARLSFLVSGGTGSGKTTLLSALLGLVGPGERIVLAEDSAELRPDHPHVVRLETRPANQEGVGLVTLEDLVRQALRMRPDRLVVGEVRGAEVVHLLAALNTGHEGGCLVKPCTHSRRSAHEEPRPTNRVTVWVGRGSVTRYRGPCRLPGVGWGVRAFACSRHAHRVVPGPLVLWISRMGTTSFLTVWHFTHRAMRPRRGRSSEVTLAPPLRPSGRTP